MSGSGAFLSPIDFRISTQIPNGEKLGREEAAAIGELYSFSFQTIHAFVDYCGIGPQTPSIWSLLAGNPKTLLAGNLNRLYVTASETIAYGAAISLTNVAGALRVRKANATDNTRICDGFCCFPGGITIGEVGEVILNSGLAPVAGLVVGARYWLSTTAGLISNAPAVGAGNIEQYLGIAITTTSLSFNISNWLQH